MSSAIILVIRRSVGTRLDRRKSPSPRPFALPRDILNLFYSDDDGGDPDRWIKFDRYPRAVIRRIVRGPRRIMGMERMFLNLIAGLDRLGVRYRLNDFAHLSRHPGEVTGVVGKPPILERIPRETPIIFGPAGYNHPIDAPTLFTDHHVIGVLVPCEWERQMFAVCWPDKVHVWPVGIDTDAWAPAAGAVKDIDVLVYNKIRFHPARDTAAVGEPVLETLRTSGRRIASLVYGHYRETEFRALLKRSRSMVFLCEHETQGIALQQALSCDVPVYAWDAGGPWQDTDYYPDRVNFAPVTSVPYWDDRCGSKFIDAASFRAGFSSFWSRVIDGSFSPRHFILDNLTLETGARGYVDLVERLSAGINGASLAGRIERQGLAVEALEREAEETSDRRGDVDERRGASRRP